MGNPEKRFAGKTAKFAMTLLSTAVIIAASSNIAHAHAKRFEANNNDKGKVVPPYAVQADGESRSRSKYKARRVNRNPQNLSVSKDFKFYKQVASLDLTDPIQAETFLQFMDIRLAEKELNEEVVLVKENEPEASILEKAGQVNLDEKASAAAEQARQSEQQRAFKPQAEKEKSPPPVKPVIQAEKKSVADKEKEKEEARIARAIERREAREQAKVEKQKAEALRLTEEKRKAEERVWLEAKKAEERRLAEEERKAEDKARREKQKAEELRLAEEKRKAEEKQKAEERRLAEEKRKAEQRKAEALKLAEEKRIAAEKVKEEKGKADKAKADTLAQGQKRKQEELERIRNERKKERLQAEKKKEEAAQLAKQEAENAEQIKQAAARVLPSRPVAYQIGSEEDPRIINFDQAITRRFKVSGSYLDKGEHGNNIVKDNRGRDFLNVIAFWDVLVEPQSNGENHYYGSLQFPLGSRHPAIIKNTVQGDEIALGCQANEVVVLKGFETEGVDYTHGLVDAYLAHSVVMPDGTVAFQEVVRQPSFSLINVETGCMPRDIFSRSHVDPERMGHDKTLHVLPVKE